MLKAIALRAGRLLVRPASEWAAIASGEDRPGFILAYGAAMLLTPPVLLILLGLVGIGFDNVSAGTVFAIGVAGLIATAALVFGLGAIIAWVARSFDGAATYRRGLAFTLYATTPMWIGAAIGNLIDPVQRLLALIGFVWAIVLIWKGATPMLGIPQGKRGVFTFTAALSLVVIWIALLAFTLGIVMGLIGGEMAGQMRGR